MRPWRCGLAEGIDARCIRVDLGNPSTIEDAAAAIEADFGRLDISVNNAGITDRSDGQPGAASMEAVRRVFETNFFGRLAATQAMLPLLQKSASARIVNVSSGSALSRITAIRTGSSPI
ncbi:MAG: short-chain dehydrogenase/reductase [Hydrocarboniphaga sp.]|nr:short-chain dehydrogenase/reductase [Hydrocarboniphaga sp.]